MFQIDLLSDLTYFRRSYMTLNVRWENYTQRTVLRIAVSLLRVETRPRISVVCKNSDLEVREKKSSEKYSKKKY